MEAELSALTGRVEALETSVGTLAANVEDLSASVNRGFEAVDRRFEGVDTRFEALEAGLIEQREYTEFAFSRFEQKMNAGLARLEQKMEAEFAKRDGRLARIERKLDQFIDVQFRTNELVSRRLDALESRRTE